jgi:K+-sensing histidine kinase KdpD
MARGIRVGVRPKRRAIGIKRLRALEALTHGALVHLHDPTLLSELLGHVRSVMHADNAAILLLGNGGQYLTIHSVHGSEAAVAGQVRLAVRDHGPGLPSEEEAHIWERFHRVPGIEAQSGGGVGLGLGLYISRRIVEQHGGAVGVESAPGAGAEFWFTLPTRDG